MSPTNLPSLRAMQAGFDAPRAREWVIARDEATMRADAGEAAVRILGECVCE